MFVDQHPYIFIYLLGSVLVVILFMFNIALFSLIAWITKANVVAKNLRKLDPPDEESFVVKALGFLFMLLVEAALSWINVVIAIWKTVVTLLKVLRDAVAETPEAIKVLRFPLRNNPNMSREAVWAHVHAMRVKLGEIQPDEGALLSSLDDLRAAHPSFRREQALGHLRSLNVLADDVISYVLSYISLTDDQRKAKAKEELEKFLRD